MSKVKLPAWPIEPPLVSFQSLLLTHGLGMLAHQVIVEGEPSANLRQFVTTGLAVLDGQEVGNASDVYSAHQNAESAAEILRSMNDKCSQNGVEVPRRTAAAALNVRMGAQMAHAALLPYMRDSRFYMVPAIVLLRPAVELAARGVAIASGTGDEPSRFGEGQRLPTRTERRAAEISASESAKTIASIVATREPSATSPVVVYDWLCSYTHLDATVLDVTEQEKESRRVDAYAAIAYAAWLAAVAAEVVTGVRFAEWPKRWPAKLPWAS